MAKFKLTGGVEIDVLTREEMRAELQGWFDEIHRGVRFVRRIAQGTVTAGGALDMTGDDLGPAGSIVWAVTRATVHGLASGETVDFYVNEASPSGFLFNIADTDPVRVLPGPACPLNPLDRLIINGTGLTAGARITVAVQAVELPVQLAWQLIG